ncbi:MAG: DUF4168 domain-containing protein [Leptolyngbya sp. SIO3F4]|nr:DUF4168 domain-containing protein [Leptolyngbya sp. SIO3F4]
MQYPCFLTKIGQFLPGIAMMLRPRSSNTIPHWAVSTSLGLLVSTLAWLPLSTLWQRGYAQTFTAEEISNYAAAVLAMERIRKNTYAEISDLMTSRQLDITRYHLNCLSADTLDLPRAVRRPVRILLINFCNDAKKVVEENGLTTQRFNSLTVNHQEDEDLANQIQSEIARLR